MITFGENRSVDELFSVVNDLGHLLKTEIEFSICQM